MYKNHVRTSKRQDFGVTTGALYRDPVLTSHDDGSITIAWPDDQQLVCIVERSLMEQIVQTMSEFQVAARIARQEIPHE